MRGTDSRREVSGGRRGRVSAPKQALTTAPSKTGRVRTKAQFSPLTRQPPLLAGQPTEMHHSLSVLTIPALLLTPFLLLLTTSNAQPQDTANVLSTSTSIDLTTITGDKMGAAAFIPGGSGTFIIYQDADTSIKSLRGTGPPISGATYAGAELLPQGRARNDTPLAVAVEGSGVYYNVSCCEVDAHLINAIAGVMVPCERGRAFQTFAVRMLTATGLGLDPRVLSQRRGVHRGDLCPGILVASATRLDGWHSQCAADLLFGAIESPVCAC